MPAASADSDTYPAYRKSAREEPLPGYVLLEPLGRGGFGEVWKCEAPGGLHKAIKFVAGANSEDTASSNQFQQEFGAFEQIKSIRHPFLLTLERVELIDGDLVMVMELADRQMRDRFDECRESGLPGIPRDELLRYFSEAAEALDVINSDHQLQHLDVKPANLFITAGHVKLGDYGLVSRLDGKKDAGSARGLTPKYVAPEVLRGGVDPRSDQYSLALVYQEMLTGTFPYAGRRAQQLMIAHVSAVPDLSALPEGDRAAVAKALSKKPEDRFPRCQDFVRELLAASAAPSPSPGSRAEISRLGYSNPSIEMTPGPSERTSRHIAPASGTVPDEEASRAEITHLLNGPTSQRASGSPAMPALVAATRWPSIQAAPATPAPRKPQEPAEEKLPLAEPLAPARLFVNPIRSVIPLERLQGQKVPNSATTVQEFSTAVLEMAGRDGHVAQMAGEVGRLADGSSICRFPSTVPELFAPLKLGIVRDKWDLTMDPPVDGRLVFRKSASGGMWSALSGKKGGLEVVVQLARGAKAVGIGEVTITGKLYGVPERRFVDASQTAIPRILDEMKSELANVADRRKSPRIASDLAVTVYPLHSDGSLEPPVAGQCKDVSACGVCFSTATSIRTRYAYLEFGSVAATSGRAVLVKLIRSHPTSSGTGHVYAGPYRVDL